MRKRQEVNEEVLVNLVKIIRQVHSRMGTRKLYNLMKSKITDMGIQIGRDRLFEVLRSNGLLIESRPRKSRTTYSNHGFRTYTNLIRHIEPSMPNQIWVSDITYLRTYLGFVYLSLITDAFSRKIVGHDVSDSLGVDGCLRALKRALSELPEGSHPIHHSDRGSQYCCGEYVKLLESRGLSISMTESNHCYENALAERVNGILKQEYHLGMNFRTKSQAKTAAAQAVLIYNELRPHLSLNYQTPSSVHGLTDTAPSPYRLRSTWDFFQLRDSLKVGDNEKATVNF